MIREQFQGKEEMHIVQRPVFQLDIDNVCLQELGFPTVVIPGEKAAATLQFPLHGWRGCVDECSPPFGRGWEKQRRASSCWGMA